MSSRLVPRARQAVRGGGFAAITSGMLPLYAAADALAPPADKDRVRDEWLRRWSSALLRLFAIDVSLLGNTAARDGRGRMIVSNHRSAIDIGILLGAFGGHMVSRADLSSWPIVGAAARKVGTVFVDRSSARSGASAIRTIQKLLKNGQTVSVFAEGTTFGDDVVRPFHAGSFVAALETNAHIVPVGLAYERGSGAAFVNESFLSHLARMARSPRSRVVVCVGDPIEVPPKARAAHLAERTHAAVQELVDRARVRCDDPPARS